MLEDEDGTGDVSLVLRSKDADSDSANLLVMVAVVPDSTDGWLLDKLKMNGLRVVEYESGNEKKQRKHCRRRCALSPKNGRGSLITNNASSKGIVPQGKANVKRENENVTTIHNLTEADLEAMYESPGIPVKSMLEDEDGEGKTIWSVGGITGRSLSPSFGSSSNHSGMRRTNSGRKASSNTIKSRKKIRNSE